MGIQNLQKIEVSSEEQDKYRYIPLVWVFE